MESRERELAERRKVLMDRRLHCEQRRRKIQVEIDDVQAVSTEERAEFERLRTDLLRSMENEEGERHAQEMRESRNHLIEAEVETRRVLAERDRLSTCLLQDEKDYHVRLDDLTRQRRQVLQMREELKEEMVQ